MCKFSVAGGTKRAYILWFHFRPLMSLVPCHMYTMTRTSNCLAGSVNECDRYIIEHVWVKTVCMKAHSSKVDMDLICKASNPGYTIM
jgi:hypothetical protein